MGRIFASEIWWAYFREGLFWGGGGGLLLEFYGKIQIQQIIWQTDTQRKYIRQLCDMMSHKKGFNKFSSLRQDTSIMYEV